MGGANSKARCLAKLAKGLSPKMPLFNAPRDNLLNLAGWLCDLADCLRHQRKLGDAGA